MINICISYNTMNSYFKAYIKFSVYMEIISSFVNKQINNRGIQT